MSGRHRTPTTNLCLTRAGALGLMLAAPLAVPGPAMAAQPSGSWLAPEESPRDDDTGDYLDRYREQQRDAREQNRERRRDENSDDNDDRDNDDRDDEDRLGHRGSSADRDGSSTRRSRAREADVRSRDRETDITSSRDDDDSEGEDQDARWDELAECESSQSWDADTGNGYQGGLQFSEATWREHGGRKYAPSADQASREEQIEVAKDVQREQGWGAWPSCSEKLGYT